MNILFIAPRLHTNINYSLKALKSKGHNISYIAQQRGLIEDYSEVKPHIINRKDFIIKNIFIIFRLISSFKPEYAIVRFPGNLLTYLTVIIAKIFNSKIILYQQIQSKSLVRILNSNNKLIAKIKYKLFLTMLNACIVTPLNNHNNKELKLHKNVYFLPFTVNVENRSYILKKKKRILSIGKFQYRKNHLNSLKAINQIKKLGNFHFTIIGEISSAEHWNNFIEIHSYIENNDLSDKVSIFANIEHLKIANFYRENDIFLLISKNEPAAISPLEAIGYGLINICSKECGTITYIKNNLNGYIVDPEKLDDLVEILNKLLIDESLFKNTFNNVQKLNYNLSKEYYYDHFLSIINDRFSNKRNEKI